MTTTTDPALINPRAVRLVKAFKDFLARMRDEEGLTFDDFSVAADLLQRVQANTGAPLAMVFGPLYSEVFLDGRDGYTPSAGVDSATVIPGSPRIGNPGTLPMRPDEPAGHRPEPATCEMRGQGLPIPSPAPSHGGTTSNCGESPRRPAMITINRKSFASAVPDRSGTAPSTRSLTRATSYHAPCLALFVDMLLLCRASAR
ncbi:hypothetical protein [Streptomyces pseudoechinosporeus]